MDAPVTVSFRRRESFLVIIAESESCLNFAQTCTFPLINRCRKNEFIITWAWLHVKDDLIWARLSRVSARIDPPGSEDIFTVSTESLKGQNSKSCSTHRALPSMPPTSHNCHTLQEAPLWGWPNRWCRLLSQNKLNFTKQDVLFQPLISPTRRASEDNEQSAHLIVSLENGKTDVCTSLRTHGRDSSSSSWLRPGESSYFSGLGTSTEAVPRRQLFTNKLPVHAAPVPCCFCPAPQKPCSSGSAEAQQAGGGSTASLGRISRRSWHAGLQQESKSR